MFYAFLVKPIVLFSRFLYFYNTTIGFSTFLSENIVKPGQGNNQDKGKEVGQGNNHDNGKAVGPE